MKKSLKYSFKKISFYLSLFFLLLLSFNNCGPTGFQLKDIDSGLGSTASSSTTDSPASGGTQNQPPPVPTPNPLPSPEPSPMSAPGPAPAPSPSPSDPRFACGGKVEAEAWALWDGDTYMHKFILENRDRVVRDHDVYGLYDFQIQSYNLWAMAKRCGRFQRLQEVARILASFYTALEPLPAPQIGRGWICRGGTICPSAGLMNREIRLTSSQFLGLATYIANALVTSGGTLTAEDRSFISDTLQIASEHLYRWSSDYEIDRLRQVIKAKPEDVKPNDSFLFFSDQDLWPLISYMEIANIRKWQRGQGMTENEFIVKNESRFRTHVGVLIEALQAHTTIFKSPTARLPNVEQADLGRGFWRLMDGDQYAGYEGTMKPVTCSPTVKVNVSPPGPRADIGWDFSHARRLVNGMESLENNREAVKVIYGLTESQMPSTSFPKAFAANLVNSIWNGSLTEPLFSNFMSGANGWFLAYSTSQGCGEGYGPYFYTDTFPTGGFIGWSKYYPVIGQLGARFYDLTSAPEGYNSDFIVARYPRLKGPVADGNRAISTFMFLPTLVGVPGVTSK